MQTPSASAPAGNPSRPLLALDLGSSVGRLLTGEINTEGQLTLKEIARFDNGPVQIGNRQYWDFLHLWKGISQALSQAAVQLTGPATLGIDSFGADYAYTDVRGALINNMRHMRDSRTHPLLSVAYQLCDKRELYQRTGAMEIEINTLFQLLADQQARPWLFEVAQHFHFAPGLVTYFLTGETLCDISMASTSQLVDPRRRDWDQQLINQMGLPARLFPTLVEPGTPIAAISKQVKQQLGLTQDIEVIAVASHDTASAAAAVPYQQLDGSAFLSLGTWSLIGVERDTGDYSDRSFQANFTNECGIEGSILYHKIQAGLWIFQELQRIWRRHWPALSLAEIEQQARDTPRLAYLFDANDVSLREPLSMPEQIIQWFVDRNLPAPSTPGQIARAAYESLALSYRVSLQAINQLQEQPVQQLYVVGGGARIDFLLQNIADATGLEVIAGPTEATAIGNMLAQLKARGEIDNIQAGRELVRRSFPLRHFTPDTALADHWQSAYQQLQPWFNPAS